MLLNLFENYVQFHQFEDYSINVTKVYSKKKTGYQYSSKIESAGSNLSAINSLDSIKYV